MIGKDSMFSAFYPDLSNRVTRLEITAVASAKSLDAVSTFIALRFNPYIEESVPFSRLVIEVFGLPLGLFVTSVIAIGAVVMAAEIGANFCSWSRKVLKADPDAYDYPCIARHGTYLLTSFIFVVAAGWNIWLVIG